MRKILIAAVAGAALIGGGAIAIAATQGGTSANAPPLGGPHRMMEEADADRDGAVSRAEFDAGVRARFERMDANRDGALTREEQRAARELFRQAHPRPERDANNDGALSRDEFLAGPNAMFDRMDANRDGRLTAEERPAHRGEGRRGHGMRHGGGMRGADANNDGSVSLAEFTARSSEMFSRMDANGDGSLTPADREARRQQR